MELPQIHIYNLKGPCTLQLKLQSSYRPYILQLQLQRYYLLTWYISGMTDLETSRPYFICRINRLSQAQALHKEFPESCLAICYPKNME